MPSFYVPKLSIQVYRLSNVAGFHSGEDSNCDHCSMASCSLAGGH